MIFLAINDTLSASVLCNRISTGRFPLILVASLAYIFAGLRFFARSYMQGWEIEAYTVFQLVSGVTSESVSLT